jgi:chorismate mutase
MHPRYLIAGPCSAETREQVLATAEGLTAVDGLTAFRAGVWKPRTRPNHFEGAGIAALPWLAEVHQFYGFPIAVEVAHPSHVEALAQYPIAMVWIGARTTVSPFAVQELAEALRGTTMQVWVKNPVNPEVPLWVGAVERLAQAGLSNIGLVHRGFSLHQRGEYRNPPQWALALEMRRLMPQLPMICDPSHISGRRSGLLSVAQRAMDLAMDGLMLETHCNPDHAWSDAQQQITPQDLVELLAALTVRQKELTDAVAQSQIERFRESIDGIDREILTQIAERMAVNQQIAALKSLHSVTAFQLERWQEMLLDRLQLAQQLGLSADLCNQLFQLLHQEAVLLQASAMSNEGVQSPSV